DLVERPHDAALEDAPEAFNRVGMDRADNVLARAMIGRAAIVFLQAVIDRAFVRRQEADLIGYDLAHELLGFGFRDAPEIADHDIALAAYGPDNRLHC